MRIALFTILSFMWLSFPSLHAQHSKIKPPVQATNRINNAAVKSALQTTPLFKSIPTETKKIESRAVTPVVGNSFDGTSSVESTPQANTIAISTSGIIVSANNGGIEYYSEGGERLYFDQWSDFFDDNSLTSTFFDPKVLYDTEEERFILVVLHGSSAATSRVVLSFSKTANPMDGWNVYKLPGNLTGSNWFDYPAIGVSNNEVFVSGNLFGDDDVFRQAVVMQISKIDGYVGAILDWQYWTDFFHGPLTITPASYGQEGNYGPGIYLVSTVVAGDDHYWFWDLTDDISGDPELTAYIIPSTPYSPAANALHGAVPDGLDNGDCRVQSAFYLDGIIHFVFHADIGAGWSGINYNRLSIPNQNVITSRFGEEGVSDYSYPSVASFATSPSDHSVMIGFLRSSPAIFPEFRVVNADQGMSWSNTTLVKSGETFVEFITAEEQWGNYTGIARRHGINTPRVMTAGSYGANISQGGITSTYKTRIAEVHDGNVSATHDLTSIMDIAVFPNPVLDLIQLRFKVEKQEDLTIAIYDLQGQLIKMLYRDSPHIGDHTLSFNIEALIPGTYVLSIASATQILASEKIMIAD